MKKLSALTGRYRLLFDISLLMLCISLITRLGLTWYEGDAANLSPPKLIEILAVGFVYDLAALSWMLIPFSLNALVWPQGTVGRRLHAITATVLFAIFVIAMLFTSVAEFVFWNEFASRFNFIAVDYLVYTREVIGNIRQSYPVEKVLAAIFAASFFIITLFSRRVWRLASADAPMLRKRMVIWLCLSMLPAVAFFGLGESQHRQMDSPSARELASNGAYAFFRAFRNNELSYSHYYRMLSSAKVSDTLGEELLESHSSARGISPGDRIARRIPAEGPALGWNVVLVSIESLGSDYVESFGGYKGLTPNLDALTDISLTFRNLFATGLRTVRGLEAISLSLPPTPGRAVPIRERNKGLPTLGSVLKKNGYDVMYLYGGYAAFDNMRDFFSGNGYEVLDRSAIPGNRISHETIWGVADEDLYQLALQEMDARAGKEKPVFAHIMTTSNHRPFTYPDGRVDIPPHSGRDGAVKYTDWAIGEFLRKAKQRSWFSNTIFVFLADHTSHGRGRTDLPPENYRIPMWIYAPGLVEPARIDDVASQIDVAPTLLSLLNISYDSHFYGQDILHEAHFHPRAFMANYLTIGYMEHGMIVELGPRQYVRVTRADNGEDVALDDPVAASLIDEAISYYQDASAYLEKCSHISAEPESNCTRLPVGDASSH